MAADKHGLLPPDYDGEAPSGYFAAKSPSYSGWLVVRGFLVDDKPDQAVASLKTVNIYPLAQAANPPAMTYLNGSGKPIDTLFPDTYAYFAPRRAGRTGTGGVDPSEECFLLAALGIENGTPFDPDAAMKQLLGEAARHDTDCPGPGDVTSRPHGS